MVFFSHNVGPIAERHFGITHLPGRVGMQRFKRKWSMVDHSVYLHSAGETESMPDCIHSQLHSQLHAMTLGEVLSYKDFTFANSTWKAFH